MSILVIKLKFSSEQYIFNINNEISDDNDKIEEDNKGKVDMRVTLV
jgi:hypothetical protein